MKMLRPLALIVLLELGFTPLVSAAPITVTFTGDIVSVLSVLNPPLDETMTFTGSFTYDSSTVPRAGATFNSAEFDAVSNVNFSIGGGVYSASMNGVSLPEIEIENNDAALGDIFTLISDGLTGTGVPGYSLLQFNLRLSDSTAAALGDAQNLPGALSLASFDSTLFILDFQDDTDPGVGIGAIYGPLTSLTTSPTVVPEPASLFLLGLGLLAVAGVRRYRHHR